MHRARGEGRAGTGLANGEREGQLKLRAICVCSPGEQCSWYWKVLCRLPKGKSKQVPSYKPSVYSGELPAYTLRQCWHKSCGNSQFTI